MHNIFLLVVISNDMNVFELVNREKLHPDKSSETNEVLMYVSSDVQIGTIIMNTQNHV